MTPDRRTLLALFAIAFGLRIAYAAVFGTDPEINPNPETYDYRTAVRMHDNITWLTTPHSPTAPLYGIILALVMRVFGSGLWTVILFQAAVGGAMMFFMFRIGEQRLGKGVGLLSSLWLAVSVHQMHYASIAIRDTVVTFVFAWFVYTLVTQFSRMRQSVKAGVAFTLLVHIEPMFMLLFPVVAVMMWLNATQHRILNVQYTFLFLSTVLLLSLPWAFRNYAVYNEFVPTSLEGSRYTEPVRRALGMVPPVPEAVRRDQRRPGFWYNTREFWRVTRFTGAPVDTQRRVGAQPPWSLRHNLINIVSFGSLLPFFGYGVYLGVRRRKWVVLVLCGAVLCYYLLRAMYGASEHTRLPIEPFVMLIAFYAVMDIVSRWKQRGREPADA